MLIERLPKHVSRNLFRAGIMTDEALVAMSYEELLKIRYVGHSAIETINKMVRIPMGLEPLVRPELKEMHPNVRVGLDRYWAAYNRGEAKNGRFGYKKMKS